MRWKEKRLFKDCAPGIFSKKLKIKKILTVGPLSGRPYPDGNLLKIKKSLIKKIFLL